MFKPWKMLAKPESSTLKGRFVTNKVSFEGVL
jgi:hypothetical protein